MFFSSSGRDVIVIVCGQMPAECAQSHSLAIKMVIVSLYPLYLISLSPIFLNVFSCLVNVYNWESLRSEISKLLHYIIIVFISLPIISYRIKVTKDIQWVMIHNEKYHISLLYLLKVHCYPAPELTCADVDISILHLNSNKGSYHINVVWMFFQLVSHTWKHYYVETVNWNS